MTPQVPAASPLPIHSGRSQALFDVQRTLKRIYVDEDPYFKVGQNSLTL